MRKIVFFSFFLSVVEGYCQPAMDGNYTLPVEHVWGVPGNMCIDTVYQTDSITLYGLAYRGYFYLREHTVNWRDEWLRVQSKTYNALYSQKDAQLGDDGYWYFTRGYHELAEPMLFIIGGDTFIAFNRSVLAKPAEIGNALSDFQWMKEGTFRKLIDGSIKLGKDGWGEFKPGLWDDGIESLSAWSTLSETVRGKQVVYGAERMRYPFSSACDSELNFNNFTLFWAEGEKGPGTGGTIDILFNRPTDHVMVLNGAVDISRLNLYKDNNRLRKVLVTSRDDSFSIEHEFEDWVAFHKIAFPAETTGVTMTILEVYPGRRWDDTCVSAVFLKQRPLRPAAEYQAVIETYVRLKGIDKMIEAYERESGGPASFASAGGAGSFMGLASTQRIHR